MRPRLPHAIGQAAASNVAIAAASSLPRCALAASSSSLVAPAAGSRCLHTPAPVTRFTSDWLQFLNEKASLASLVHKLQQALAMMRASPYPPSEREILLVLRKAGDSARYVQRQSERDANRCRKRQAMEAKWQQSMRVLFTTCAQMMSLTPGLNELPLERWRLNRGTLRAFLILAVRCHAYEPACNLIAHCESVHPIDLARVETKEIHDAVKKGKPVDWVNLDDTMLNAILTALAHARPKPGLVENVEESDPTKSLFEKVISAAPASFTPERSATLCEDILQRIVALPSANIPNIPISSSMLEAFSVLFTVHPDPQLRSLVFAQDPRFARTITLPAPASPSGSTPKQKPRPIRLGWTNESVDHDSFTSQARSLVRAWETYLLSRAAAPDFRWPQDATPLTNLFLGILAERAETVTLPLMRSDLLAGVLYACSVSNLDKFPVVFERVRMCFPGPAVALGELSYGMDASVWAVALHVLLAPGVEPAEAAQLFAEACRVVPRRLQLPLINAYLGYLCEVSAETLPERWTRMQQVLANAIKIEAVPSTAVVSLPHTFIETARAAWTAADEMAKADHFALTQPDLVLYSHVIRLLDRLHEQQVPFTLLAQSTVASPAPLGPDSAMGAFLPLFAAPEPSADTDPTASGWQLIADELHHRAQEERERAPLALARHSARRGSGATPVTPAAALPPGPGFFRFNPSTHNLFVPTSGLLAADDQWIHAMCRLACRALQRAGQMKSVFDAQGGGQPLTLVVETEADARTFGVERAAEAAARPTAASSPDSSAASYWRSLSNTPASYGPVSLPSDWLYHAHDTRVARMRGDRPVRKFAEWLRPDVRPSERVLHALRAVFDEMGWKHEEPLTVQRSQGRPQAQTAASDATAQSTSRAKEFVFTFDAQKPATALH